MEIPGTILCDTSLQNLFLHLFKYCTLVKIDSSLFLLKYFQILIVNVTLPKLNYNLTTLPRHYKLITAEVFHKPKPSIHVS